MGVDTLTVDSGFLRVFFIRLLWVGFFFGLGFFPQFFCSITLGLCTSFMEVLFLLDRLEGLAGNTSVEIQRKKPKTQECRIIGRWPLGKRPK